MLNWLKRRAKVTINNRYLNIFRSNNINSNMFVSDTQTVSFISDHVLKLTVLNDSGNDYCVSVPSGSTVERLKVMAVGHFFSHVEAVGGSHPADRPGGATDSKAAGNRSFRLVVVRGARTLPDESSLHFEKLIDNDELLLVERREPPPQPKESPEAILSPTQNQIDMATAHVKKQNDNRDPDPTNSNSDFQTELRRILITMIEASVRLISADPESKEVFNQILDKLEKRHRPRVDRNSLRQLVEMGFDEVRATKALQVKRDFNEAVEWLLEEGNLDDSETGNEADLGSSFAADKLSLEDQQEDPAKTVLRQFLQYRKKWFKPNQQAVEKFVQMGYPRERVIDALRVKGNNETLVVDLLADDKPIPPDDEGLDRSSPIISAILASPVIQLALPKPKTLLALMMLFESPNNANMWLSDPDTHPVVSQVLRIYHAEKHSLNHNRAATAPAPTPVPVPAPVYQRPFPEISTQSGLNARPSPVFVVRAGTQSYPGYQARSSSPASHSHTDSVPGSTLAPSQYEHISSEEPMSLSGSPVRAMVMEQRQVSSMANGGPQQVTPYFQCNLPILQNNSPATSLDVEMEDSAQDSQEMDTQ